MVSAGGCHDRQSADLKIKPPLREDRWWSRPPRASAASGGRGTDLGRSSAASPVVADDLGMPAPLAEGEVWLADPPRLGYMVHRQMRAEIIRCLFGGCLDRAAVEGTAHA